MSKIVAIKSHKDDEEKIGFLKKDIPETEEYKRMIRRIEHAEIRERNRKIEASPMLLQYITYLSE